APLPAQACGVRRIRLPPGRTQHRQRQCIGRNGSGIRVVTRHAVEYVPQRRQHLALQGIPAHSAATFVFSRRRQSHITGPDRAYREAAISRVTGGSIHSAISNATAISSATNGTRSDFGPEPPPLKLV